MLGLSFEVRAADVDETLLPGETAAAAAERLARAKVEKILPAAGEALVIGADTLVVLDGQALGKPVDEADARRMLRALSGRRHEAVTGVAIGYGGKIVSGLETTGVVFATLSEDEISRYVRTGEPDDKAGAYALQGIGGLFVERIEGSPSNVIGLPIRLLRELALRAGVDLL